MSYDNLSQLPLSYRENLPLHAQEIYLVAFNNAWSLYTDLNAQENGANREQVAHQVAWAAVKEKFEERDGQWVRK